MNFHTYLFSLSKEDRVKLADGCKTSVGHLNNVSYGKSASPALSVLIEKMSNGAVTRKSMRPNDWSLIWPELAAKSCVK
jgi:DNA-binding transcriptional regulator YdaS (Cro superfamily)